ncbi:MAG: hypothetical protein HQL86_06455 [Magnetococcales bacterium]|nr:hypothetical protein [Magnetococcales bacterium]
MNPQTHILYSLRQLSQSVLAGAAGGGILLATDLDRLRAWVANLIGEAVFIDGVTVPVLFATVGMVAAAAIAWLAESRSLPDRDNPANR